MKEKTRIILEAVKFEHTIFALPFAYLGLVLAEDGWPRLHIFFWVTAAMAGLRTAGMLFNRIFDEDIDRMNPRTKNRALPAGLLTQRAAWTTAAISSSVYFIAALMLNPLCFKLSLIPFVLAFIYPFFKRWTFFCHLGIGAVLSGAPLGGWLASRGNFAGAPFLVSAAVLFWVAGFDILYALQDIDSDKRSGLCSIPAAFGERFALSVAAFFHAVTLGCLLAFGWIADLGMIYASGLVLIAVFLLRQNLLVFRHGLERIHEAFFTLNASVSVAIFLFTFLDLLVR
ncbi:MAG: 4-hydroxybenzoate octaprenyltransferase [Candidatus Omnitrophica bacterium]|nr:4-hydroxybenzoate octaprenyltransferase [Candidatus Omnitrophota bacterium]